MSDTLTEILLSCIKDAGIEKINKRTKEAFLKQYYFEGNYEFMTHKDIKEALILDGVIEDE